MRELTAGLTAALTAAAVRPVLIVQVTTGSGDLRLWSGIGDLLWNAQTFAGAGNLLSVSPVSEASDMRATGLSFSLSGVPVALIAAALGDMRQGRPAKLWLGCLNDAGALIADPVLLFTGLTDVPSIEEGAENATITLSAESRLIDLERPRVRRYTPEDQQIDYPGDLGFDFVAELQNKDVKWGFL